MQLVNSIPALFFKKRNKSSLDEALMTYDLSIQRLAEKLQKLENGLPLKIVTIGGSMSIGQVDVIPSSLLGSKRVTRGGFLVLREMAWPRKVEQLMNEKWGGVTVINMAQGAANENYWLGQLDRIKAHAPFDIILVEFAVNDPGSFEEMNFRANMVHNNSDKILNILMNFPSEPAVLTVELFRTSNNDRKYGNKLCAGHLEQIKNSLEKPCLYCPQWWAPQDWRKKAREKNSVSYISYRDAIWPAYSRPPSNLCYDYWYGKSHPQSGTHSLVASTILFQFMVVMHMKEKLLSLFHENRLTDNDKLQLSTRASEECISPISSYRATQDNPYDEMDLLNSYNQSCWKFRSDSKEKYGWICEESKNSTSSIKNNSKQKYFRLSKNISIGEKQRITLTRLVSYDRRMAMAQVWFSGVVTTKDQTFEEEHDSNIFIDNPTWNISSWHNQYESIPVTTVIDLTSLRLKNWTLLHPLIHYSNISNSQAILPYQLIFNIKMLPGSSLSSQHDPLYGLDKFKLLGLISC